MKVPKGWLCRRRRPTLRVAELFWCINHKHYYGNKCVKCGNDSEWRLHGDVIVETEYKRYGCNNQIIKKLLCENIDDEIVIIHWQCLDKICVYNSFGEKICSNYSYIIPKGTIIYYHQDTDDKLCIFVNENELLEWNKRYLFSPERDKFM